MLLVLCICHLVPTHLFLYSFYIIPRRFYASSSEDMSLENEQGRLNEPLLVENLNQLEDEMDWQKRAVGSRPSQVNGGESSNGTNSPNHKSLSSAGNSAIYSRLSGRAIRPRTSFKVSRSKEQDELPSGIADDNFVPLDRKESFYR